MKCLTEVLGPGPAGCKLDTSVKTNDGCTIVAAHRAHLPTAAPRAVSKFTPRKDLNMDPRGWASGSPGSSCPGSAEDRKVGKALAHPPPPAKSKAGRLQSTPAETGQAHCSGTDISDRGGNILSWPPDTKTTTETKHEPERT